MSAFATTSDTLRQQLRVSYQGLSDLHQQILRLFSVFYEPVNRTIFLQCLNAINVRQDNGKNFNSSTLKPHIEYLIKQDLLIQERGLSPRCNHLIAEIATRDAISAGTWLGMVKTIEIYFPIPTQYNDENVKRFNSQKQLLREVRIGIYRQDIEYVLLQVESYKKYAYGAKSISLDEILQLVLNNPFDVQWFEQLPQDLYEVGLHSILLDSVLNLTSSQSQFDLLQALATGSNDRCSDSLRLLLAEQLILRDDVVAARHCLEQVSKEAQEASKVLWGWLAFLEGDYKKAIALYTTAYQSLKKSTRKKKVYFESIGGIFFILALLQDGSTTSLKEATVHAKIMAAKSNHWLQYVYTWLFRVLEIQQGDMSHRDWIENAYIFAYDESTSIETFICSLCLYWADEAQARKRVPRFLKLLSDRAEKVGYYWLAVKAAELLFRLKTKKNLGKELSANNDIPALVDLIKPKQPWELSLKALANLQKPEIEVRIESEKRLVWLLAFYSTRFVLQPREQKITVKGTWSKGRPINLTT